MADLNNDERVDALDFAILTREWLETDSNPPPINMLRADLNNDKKVNTLDFTILAEEWRPGFNLIAPSLPEPNLIQCEEIDYFKADSDELERICVLPCNDTSGWATRYDCVLTYDYNNVVYYTDVKRALKIVTTPGTHGEKCGQIERVFPVPADMRDINGNDPYFRAKVYFHEGSGNSICSNITRLMIRAFSKSGAYRTGYFAGLNNNWPGWYVCTISPSQFATGGSGTFSWGNIYRIDIRVEKKYDDKTPSVTVGQLEFLQRPGRATFQIHFDNGYAECYNYAAYLTSKGMPATFYVNPAFVGAQGYLTLSQLTEMHEAGHLIANHTWNHTEWRLSSDEDMVDGVTMASEWLNANGFADGARLLALPSGSSAWKPNNTGICLFLRGGYVDQLRLTTNPSGNDKTSQWYSPDFFFVSSGDNISGSLNALNAAIADEGPAIVYFHKAGFGGNTWTFDQLKCFIDAVAAARDSGQIEVITAADMLRARQIE
ncbi:MAG: polysaccharide deacetylase family protein [Phycisphaerae bacterium]